MSQDPKSRGLIYAARMRYLQSREGRRSGLRLTGDGTRQDDDHLYLAKRELCDPGVLTPPPEVTTRSQAFKRAYWRYHCKPIVQSIEKSFPSPPKGKELKDERKERLSRKRVEILAKVRSGCGRQAVMTRRAGMALSGQTNGGIELNGSSNSGIESEESGDENESELEEQLGRITLIATSPPRQPGGVSPGRTNAKSSSLDFTPRTSDDANKNRRTTIHAEEETVRCENQADENTPLHDAKQAGETRREEDDAGRCRRTVNQPRKNSQRTGGNKQEDSAFSFLSEWKIEPPKKKW
jgi:hypothetical protein